MSLTALKEPPMIRLKEPLKSEFFRVSDKAPFYDFSPPFARVFFGFWGKGLGARKLSPSRMT